MNEHVNPAHRGILNSMFSAAAARATNQVEREAMAQVAAAQRAEDQRRMQAALQDQQQQAQLRGDLT